MSVITLEKIESPLFHQDIFLKILKFDFLYRIQNIGREVMN